MLRKIKYYLNRMHFCIRQHNSYNASAFTIFKAALLGFTADEWIIFELDKNNPKDYLSEYDRSCFRRKALNYRILFDNKLLFYNVFKEIAPLNKLYAHKDHGIYKCIDEAFQIESVCNSLKNVGKIVYKPTFDGGGGNGFALLEYRDNCYFRNREECAEVDIINLLKDTDNYMIEEYCKQSDFENEIFEDTVNTLRIITIEYDGEYKVMAIMQRLGSIKNACADNASLGGLFCEVDLHTGELSTAFSYSPDLLFDVNGHKQFFEKHPTTGKKLKGRQIPNLDYIKSEACRIHSEIRYTGAKFVAWDFALTNDGYRVIEGNTSSGMKFIQFHKGAKNSEIGKWMVKYGYINK